jgi:hypothetical protein
MSNVFYIRLVSGEEVVAEVVQETPAFIILNNPLMIESSSSEEGDHLIFMSRYNPYSKDSSVVIKRDHVCVYQTASDTMDEYYTKSVDFCKVYIDDKFKVGIQSATSHVDNALKQIMIDGTINTGSDTMYSEEDDFINKQEESNTKPPTVH